LHPETPLRPFKKNDRDFYTTLDVTNITELGYEYGPGSVDTWSEPLTANVAPFVALKKVSNINRGNISGSFVIRAYAENSKGQEIEIGREAILSRWQTDGCANCQTHLDAQAIFPIDKVMLEALQGDQKKEVRYSAKVQTHFGYELHAGAPQPTIEDL